MTDLIFGMGVPAFAAADDDPPGLALEAERLGFDFVSAADHPRGPSPSYETTTMLTWIAARTSRIKVASRVLAVPFRRPAMVAKLAASLDLLSGGRFTLGLGAGYSDREIAALGAPELSPAGRIDALAEAIQVIRGAGTHPRYTQDGRYHGVRDLEMEPKPARAIPVWLGAFGPRALAVTGALADGWIPSLGYMPVEDIPAMRRRIDAAAEAAGRPPEAIRSILNVNIGIGSGAQPQPDAVTGSAAQVASQLRHLLDLGFTGFNDQTGRLWMRGVFTNKPVTSFTASINRHGGSEATLLSLNNVFYHWGSIIVPTGYTDPLLYAAGGNPYGTSFATGPEFSLPDEAVLAAAHYQGRRLADVAARLMAGVDTATATSRTVSGARRAAGPRHASRHGSTRPAPARPRPRPRQRTGESPASPQQALEHRLHRPPRRTRTRTPTLTRRTVGVTH